MIMAEHTLKFLWVYLIFQILLLCTGNSQIIVENLPGYDGKLPFKLETGYVGVGENEERQLFYYFIESGRDPVRDPLVLWLSGGPGCSGFSALVYEIGTHDWSGFLPLIWNDECPLKFNVEAFNGSFPSFKLNPYSFTQVANIIFVDAPVGTGFSYSTTSEGYYTSDTKSAEDSFEFLKKWLKNHPQFFTNRLYVMGDSYSGILVPAIVTKIENARRNGERPRLNLIGYVIGNPVTDQVLDLNSRVEYAHRVSLISDELYESAKANCGGKYVKPDSNNTFCMDDLQLIGECLGNVNDAMILEPSCSFSGQKESSLQRSAGNRKDPAKDIIRLLASGQDILWCRGYSYVLSYMWANDPGVQEALFVRNGTIVDWNRCNETLAYVEDIASVVEYHRNLSVTGYRALVYSGDHDFRVPYLGTHTWISSLNLTLIDAWRPWFVDGQIAGFMEKYEHAGNYGQKYTLTFTTIKGAGHTAPEYKPKQCFEMIRRWFSYYEL